MQEILVVVDMQNDFVTGPLGTPEARTILPKVAEKVKNFPGRVLFTRDTHEENYLESREGKALPVPHCIRGTRGWEICPELETLRKEEPVDKPTFGSTGLGEVLRAADRYGETDREDHPRRRLHRYLCHLECPAPAGLPAGSGDRGRRRLLRRGDAGKPSDGPPGDESLPDYN